jgi:hypothetical protein
VLEPDDPRPDQGGVTLTLGASDKPYTFCQLNMAGSSHLIVARGAVVTIIFHSPETCGQTGNPVTQVNMTGNTQIDTTSGNPYDLRIVMVGSDDIPTKAHFTGNTGSEMTVYAPRTDVELWGNTSYFGAVAGKTLTSRPPNPTGRPPGIAILGRMQRPSAGLCDSCAHQRIVRTGRGSAFSLCQRSRNDPAYPRYPRLPVRSCTGYERRGPQPPSGA